MQWILLSIVYFDNLLVNKIQKLKTLKECKHNTYGDHCQYCLPGYQGDATRGSPYDCQPVEKKLPTTTSSTTTRTLPPTTTLYIQPEPDDDCFCNGHSFECTCSGICIVILKEKVFNLEKFCKIFKNKEVCTQYKRRQMSILR